MGGRDGRGGMGEAAVVEVSLGELLADQFFFFRGTEKGV